MAAVSRASWNRSSNGSSSVPSPRAPRAAAPAAGYGTGASAASPKAPRTPPLAASPSGTGGGVARPQVPSAQPLAHSPLPRRLASPSTPRSNLESPQATSSPSPKTPNAKVSPGSLAYRSPGSALPVARHPSLPSRAFAPLPNTWLNDKLQRPQPHGSLLAYNRGAPRSARDGDPRERSSPKVSLVRQDGAGGEVLMRTYSFQGVSGAGTAASDGYATAPSPRQAESPNGPQLKADYSGGVDGGGSLVIANTLRRNYQLGNRGSGSAVARFRNGSFADVAVSAEELAQRIGLLSCVPAFVAYVAASRKLQCFTSEELTRQLRQSVVWPSKLESLNQHLQSTVNANAGLETSKKSPRSVTDGKNSGSPTSVLEKSLYKLARLHPQLLQFYRFCRQLLLDLLLLSALEADRRVTSSHGAPFNGFALPWAAEFVSSNSSLGAITFVERPSEVSKAYGDSNGGAALRRQQLAARWFELCGIASDGGKDGADAHAHAQVSAEKVDALFEVLSRALLMLRIDELQSNVVTSSSADDEELHDAGAGGESGGGSGKRGEDELVKKWRRDASEGRGTRGALIMAGGSLSGTDASRWVLRMAGGTTSHVRQVAAFAIDRMLWDVETGRVQNELGKECARVDSNPQPAGLSRPRSLGALSVSVGSSLSLSDRLSGSLSTPDLSSSESDSSGSDGEDERTGRVGGGKAEGSSPVRSSTDVLIARVSGALVASLGAAAGGAAAHATAAAATGAGAPYNKGGSGGGGEKLPPIRTQSLPAGSEQLPSQSASTSSPLSSTSAKSSSSSSGSSNESTAGSKPNDNGSVLGAGARGSGGGGFGVGSTVLGLTSPRITSPRNLAANAAQVQAPQQLSWQQQQQQQQGRGVIPGAVCDPNYHSSRISSSVPCSPAHRSSSGDGSTGRSGRGGLDAEAAAARLRAIAAAAAEAGRSGAPESPRIGGSRFPAAPGSVISIPASYRSFTVPQSAMSLNGGMDRTFGGSSGVLRVEGRRYASSVTGDVTGNDFAGGAGYTPTGGYRPGADGHAGNAAAGGLSYSGSGRFDGERGGTGGGEGGGVGGASAAAAAVAASRLMASSVPSTPLHASASPVHYASTPVHYSSTGYSPVQSAMSTVQHGSTVQYNPAQFATSPGLCTSSPRYMINSSGTPSNPTTPRYSATGLYSSSPRHPGVPPASLYSPSPSPRYSHSPVHHAATHIAAGSPSHPGTVNPPHYASSPVHYSTPSYCPSPQGHTLSTPLHPSASPNHPHIPVSSTSCPSPAFRASPAAPKPAGSVAGKERKEGRDGSEGGSERGSSRVKVGGVKSTMRQKAFFGAGVMWNVEEGGAEEEEGADNNTNGSDNNGSEYDEGASSEEDKDDNTLGFSKKYGAYSSSSSSSYPPLVPSSPAHTTATTAPLSHPNAHSTHQRKTRAPSSPSHSALSQPSPSRSVVSASPAHEVTFESTQKTRAPSSPSHSALSQPSPSRSVLSSSPAHAPRGSPALHGKPGSTSKNPMYYPPLIPFSSPAAFSTPSASPASSAAAAGAAAASAASSAAAAPYYAAASSTAASSPAASPAASIVGSKLSSLKGSPYSRGSRMSRSESAGSNGEGGEMGVRSTSSGGCDMALRTASSNSSTGSSAGSSTGAGSEGGEGAGGVGRAARRRASKVKFVECGEIEEEEEEKEGKEEEEAAKKGAIEQEDVKEEEVAEVLPVASAAAAAAAVANLKNKEESGSPAPSALGPATEDSPAPASGSFTSFLTAHGTPSLPASSDVSASPAQAPAAQAPVAEATAAHGSPESVSGSFTSFLSARNTRPATSSTSSDGSTKVSPSAATKEATPVAVKAASTAAQLGSRVESQAGGAKVGEGKVVGSAEGSTCSLIMGEKKKGFWRWRPWRSAKAKC